MAFIFGATTWLHACMNFRLKGKFNLPNSLLNHSVWLGALWPWTYSFLFLKFRRKLIEILDWQARHLFIGIKKSEFSNFYGWLPCQLSGRWRSYLTRNILAESVGISQRSKSSLKSSTDRLIDWLFLSFLPGLPERQRGNSWEAKFHFLNARSGPCARKNSFDPCTFNRGRRKRNNLSRL